MTRASQSKPHKKNRKVEGVLAVVAIATIVIAWFASGYITGTAVEPFLELAFPSATRFDRMDEELFVALGPDDLGDETQLGYVAIGEATGYGGPMQVVVGIDHDGQVVGVSVVEHKETPTYFYRLMRLDFISELVGKTHSDPIQIGEDVDAISGATYTSWAIAEVTRDSVRRVAGGELGLPIPPEEPPKIQVGIPEFVLVALFAAGYIGHQRTFKHKKFVRWAAMLTGLIVLGFIYNAPLTLAHINSLIMGYWPDWHTNLYWYLLIGGILFVFTVDNKNPYCEWFCPFGAAQECVGVLGGAKPRSPGAYRGLLTWSQRGLAWLAILLAILFRNPGLTSYEIFGTLFDLTGSYLQFALLAIIIVAALFIRRPWCGYLCPVRPVVDLIRYVRAWVREQWRKGLLVVSGKRALSSWR